MLLDVLLVSVGVALLRGGRPAPTLPMNHSWLVLVATGLQVGAIFLPRFISPILILLSYGVLLFFLIRNVSRQSLSFVFVGVLLNFVVIAVNGGRMPVSIPAADRVGYDVAPLVAGTDFKRVAMGDDTKFSFLGDVIFVPVPVKRVISIGDVAIALGAFLLVQEYLSRPITFRARRFSLYATASADASERR